MTEQVIGLESPPVSNQEPELLNRPEATAPEELELLKIAPPAALPAPPVKKEHHVYKKRPLSATACPIRFGLSDLLTVIGIGLLHLAILTVALPRQLALRPEASDAILAFLLSFGLAFGVGWLAHRAATERAVTSWWKRVMLVVLLDLGIVLAPFGLGLLILFLVYVVWGIPQPTDVYVPDSWKQE
jgi:hypothetical protein